MTSREFRDRLRRRARRAHVSLDDRLVQDLETYYRLLLTWNARINLTALNLSEPTAESLDRLLIEPVAAARHAPPLTARVMDVGSGGGSPAIPFALALGGVRLRMVEAKTRKSVFLREAIRALEMPEAEVLTIRYEELLSREAHLGQEDLLTVRAVRMDAQSVAGLAMLVRPRGQLFLFIASDSTAIPVPPELRHISTIPLVESLASSLVVLERKGPVAGNVPRGTSP